MAVDNIWLWLSHEGYFALNFVRFYYQILTLAFIIIRQYVKCICLKICAALKY